MLEEEACREKRPFRCIVEYRGDLTEFIDLEALVVFSLGKYMPDMIFWFGECPVTALHEQIEDPDVCRIRELLQMAQILSESYRDLLSAKIGTRQSHTDMRFYFQIGLEDDPSEIPHSSAIEFILNEGNHRGNRWYFYKSEGSFHTFYKIKDGKSLAELLLTEIKNKRI